MNRFHFLTAAAVASLLTGAALAQSPTVDRDAAPWSYPVARPSLPPARSESPTQAVRTSGNLKVLAPTDAPDTVSPARDPVLLMANAARFRRLLTSQVIGHTVDAAQEPKDRGQVSQSGNLDFAQTDTRLPAGLALDGGRGPTRETTKKESAKPVLTPDEAAPMVLSPADSPAGAGMEPADSAVPVGDSLSDKAAMLPDAVRPMIADTVLVTNGPVRDTVENRVKYPPESRAGSRTAARGN
ncbi:MAG: hypothetical protein QE280_11480 [Caulobacter sp.]|nr:hypothetical protein [Caulobacter sp.]